MDGKSKKRNFQKVREICLALPESHEKLTDVFMRPTFRVRDKSFVWYLDNHHDDGRVAIWCKAQPGVQESLVARDPDRFFVPPYVGPKGWVGIRLDREPLDWDEITDLIEQGYRLMAPRRLIMELDSA